MRDIIARGLIGSALKSLSSEDIIRSMYTAASEFTHFCDNLQKHTIRECLDEYEFPIQVTLDGWRFPDIVWNAICHKFPHLNAYPLGCVTERALKKTVGTLILNAAPGSSVSKGLNLTEEQVQQKLRLSVEKLGAEEVLKLFLSQWFFELSLRNLRGKRGKKQPDYSFWYHFSRDGRLAPLDSERRLREELLKQCGEKAGQFFPFLQESLREKNSLKIEQRISQGLLQVFGVQPTKVKPKPGPDKPFLNVIVGGQPQSKLEADYRIDNKVVRFMLHGKDPNVSFHFEKLEEFLVHRTHSLVRDLLDVGVIIYMADLYARRGWNLDRHVGILMPVRHPEIWERARAQLERAVSFLARDNVSIHFVQRHERRDELRDFTPKPDERCVCLLSGGIDSAAGAVWASEEGLSPTFVSHYAAPNLSGIQKGVVKGLGEIYGREFPHIRLYVAKSRKQKGRYKLGKPPSSILAQHLRSFLFLSLATAVALESKISKVYIFENGPIALNPLFCEARINTHTAHPNFIEYFRTLIQTVFGTELTIENPFCYKTKGEVASILASKKPERLVSLTNSCWHWFKVPVLASQLGIQGSKERHCGECLPCIMRRVSTYSAGLWDKDAPYLIDIFKIFDMRSFDRFPDHRRESVIAVADFVRFCQSVKEMPEPELLLHNPDFSVSAKGAEPQQLAAMYKRHAQEVLQCFRAKSSATFKKVFASALET